MLVQRLGRVEELAFVAIDWNQLATWLPSTLINHFTTKANGSVISRLELGWLGPFGCQTRSRVDLDLTGDAFSKYLCKKR